MRVVHVVFSLNTGGIENMLVDIVNNQVEFNDIHIIIINDEYNSIILSNISPKVTVHLLNRKSKSIGIISLINLNSLLFFGKFDVIHCHTHTVIKVLLKCFRRKAVLTVHDVGYFANHFKLYREIFAISKSVQSDLIDRYDLRSTVIYNGVEIEKIKSKQKNVEDRKTKIVCIGRLEHNKKGQDLLIKAISTIKDKYIIEVDFIGDGTSFNYLSNLISTYKLSHNVKLLGDKSRGYIYENLINYDILVQPSNYEGFGLTVVEGMLAKIPVIVSDIDGPFEIIEHGKYGSFFKAGNIKSLICSIESVIENYNEEKITSMVEDAYLKATKQFNIKDTANNYLKEYRKLCH
jgi:glycosyltransferase involved in cell wall biosynthesis